MRRDTRSGGGPGEGHASRKDEPLAVGREIRDSKERKSGVVVDCACQYAHPKAQPVYNYLVRWEDGQVQAISEFALRREYGIEPAD